MWESTWTFCIFLRGNAFSCPSDTSRVENTLRALKKRECREQQRSKVWYFLFLTSRFPRWNCVWCLSAAALRLPPCRSSAWKLVLFSISSPLRCGAGLVRRGGCCVCRVGWNWTASPHYCKHHPARQACGSRGHRMRGSAWERSAKTHPLRPKLFLIYMFRVFKLSHPAPESPPARLAATLCSSSWGKAVLLALLLDCSPARRKKNPLFH